MKVGIDARLYGPKWGGGGLGRYVEELVNELQRINSPHDFVIFLKPENFAKCQIINPKFKKVLVDVHWYGWREQIAMPQAIRREGIELMHYPHWNVPIFSRVPYVVTIHDLILLDDPSSARATTLGPICYAVKRIGYRLTLREAINKSKKIIAVSQATRDSIVRHFSKIDPAKIEVIYEGVRPLKSPDFPSAPSKPPAQFSDPYFLYVGSAYPHKNLMMLLRAFAFFIKTNSLVKLVLVGKDDHFYRNLKQQARQIGLPEEQLIFRGFVDDIELAELYRQAALYIYPSKFEGFGLPPLEAMLYGAPVAASNRGPLPEVLGEAAAYFDPDVCEQLVALMTRAMSDERWREALVQKGREQAKKYSWMTMAKHTFDVYEAAGGKIST